MVAATIELVLDVADLDRMAAFWTAALGYQAKGSIEQYKYLAPPAGETGPPLILQRVDEPKSVKNRLHIDIKGSDVEAEVSRLEQLGAVRVQRYEEVGTTWVLMADPEGNELCVCQA